MDDIIEFLKKLAKMAEQEPPNLEERMIDGADGGNFDDAYQMGLDDGQRLSEIEIGMMAAEILKERCTNG